MYLPVFLRTYFTMYSYRLSERWPTGTVRKLFPAGTENEISLQNKSVGRSIAQPICLKNISHEKRTFVFPCSSRRFHANERPFRLKCPDVLNIPIQTKKTLEKTSLAHDIQTLNQPSFSSVKATQHNSPFSLQSEINLDSSYGTMPVQSKFIRIHRNNLSTFFIVFILSSMP